MADEDLATAQKWATQRLWPAARGPFLDWWDTERPGPADWDTFAAFNTANTDDDEDHTFRGCDICPNWDGDAIAALNPARAGRTATDTGFEGLGA